MFFTISKVFWLAAAPSNMILFVFLAGALLWAMGRARWGRRLVVAAGGLYFVFATLPLGGMLAAPLENRFRRPPDTAPAPDGIIVLGGAMADAMIEDRGALVLGPSGSRMTEAIALALRYPQAKLVFSGGSAKLTGQSEISEAEAARLFFEAMGLPEGRVLLEDRSRNTWENAVFTRDLVQPKPGERWLLVTGATHIPRSMGIFRKVGFEVVAWPAHYFTSSRWTQVLSFNRQASDGLFLLDIAVREWIGLAVYRITGKTDDLFPAP